MKPEITSEEAQRQAAATEKERQRIADENNRAAEISRETQKQLGKIMPRKKWHPGLLEFSSEALLQESYRCSEFFE